MSLRELMHWERPSFVSIRKNTEHAFSSLQREVNKLFDDFSGTDFFSFAAKSGFQAPSIDVVENDKAFKVKVELPGMEQKDIEVSVNGNYLTIKGEKKEATEEKDENYIRRECACGCFQRTIALSELANAEKAQATFKNGILTVEVPKKAEAVTQTKKIEVKKVA